MTKRILCVLLSLIIFTATFAGLELTVSAGTNGVTQEQAGAWAEAQNGKSLDQDGVYGAQCVDLIRFYYIYLGNSPVQGNGCDYATNALPSGWQRIRYYNGFVPQRGDIAVWTYTTSSYGHVAIVTNADSSKFYVVEQNGSTHITRMWSYNYSYGTLWGFIRPDFAAPPPSVPTGSEMTSGYARTIPDGDYVIASALGRYYLDIYGSSIPEAEGSRILLCERNGVWSNIPEFDVWTLKYNSDGFYSIYQRGTNVSLDVPNSSTANRTALQTWNANNSSAQKWAIHDLGSGTCTIQAKCSGYAVDVRDAVAANNTVIQQNVVNESAAQQWRFIPYKPAVTESNKVASTTYNEHDYILYNKLMTWNDARDWCENQGGNLVTVTSEGEQAVVESLMSKVSRRIWLGASDAESEGNWKWVTGESFSYSNWASGEPNNNPASYGGYENYMELSSNGKWNDVEEYVKTIEYFILEKTHNHTSDSGTITTQPTCTQTGVKTYKCKACGETIKTETIPATGHTPGDWEIETEATANYDGLEVIRCTVCTEILEERAIPKLSGPIPGTLYLDKKPSKISYELNEAFDPTGAVLRVKYNDGTIKSLSSSDVQIVGFDTTTGGNKKVHFSYTENGVTLNTWEFTILVDRQVTAIFIPHKPNKTHYICGEAFEREGMEIIATYSDGTKADVTAEVRTSGYDSLTFGLKKMTVYYTYKGKTVTLQFSYEMNPKLTGITLTHKPNKLGTYKVGEPLSKEGMIITAKFSDGSTKDVTHLIRTSGYSSKQVGKQIITVSYTYGTQTKSVQFSIIMN